MGRCHECGRWVWGKKVLCKIDFLLAMKQTGWKNEKIREVYDYWHPVSRAFGRIANVVKALV